MRAICFIFLLAACSLHAADPKAFTVSEFAFQRPEKWKWIEPSSSMRKAQLAVPDPEKREDGEVVFFYFGPGGAGGVEANVSRWFGQFVEPKEQLNSKVEKINKNGLQITYVQAQGTYKSGPPGGQFVAKPKTMLLGAILEGQEGSVFIKYTGPASVVQATSGEFKKMVESAAKKAP